MEHAKVARVRECVEFVTGGGRCWTGAGKWAGGRSSGEIVHVVEKKGGSEACGYRSCNKPQLQTDEVIGLWCHLGWGWGGG